jgi:hypothetical protein
MDGSYSKSKDAQPRNVHRRLRVSCAPRGFTAELTLYKVFLNRIDRDPRTATTFGRHLLYFDNHQEPIRFSC